MIDFRAYPEVVSAWNRYWELFEKHDRYSRSVKPDKDKLNLLGKNRSDFLIDVYAKSVFDVLLDLDPVLIEQRTRDKILFREVFGDKFEILTFHMRVVLYFYADETTNTYFIEDRVIQPDGKIQEGVSDYPLTAVPPIWRNGLVVSDCLYFGMPLMKWKSVTPELRKANRAKWNSMPPEEQKRIIRQFLDSEKARMEG